jgi:hypothetical protein
MESIGTLQMANPQAQGDQLALQVHMTYGELEEKPDVLVPTSVLLLCTWESQCHPLGAIISSFNVTLFHPLRAAEI